MRGGLNLLGKVGVKIFVNALTMFRCVFTFAMPFLINKVSYLTFLIIVGILFFTDLLDGFISRTCKAQTLFGSIMDTVADKVLSIILILCIAEKSIVLYIMLICEILIATMNLIGTINDATIVAILTGKAKMWALAIATILGYMYYFDKCDVLPVLISGSIVIAMQVIVIWGYGNKIRKVKEIRKEKVKFKRGNELFKALFDTEYYLSTLDVPLLRKLTVENVDQN